MEVGRPVRGLLWFPMLTTPSLSPLILTNLLDLSFSAKCVKIIHYQYRLLHLLCVSVNYCFIYFETILLNTYKFMIMFFLLLMCNFYFINSLVFKFYLIDINIAILVCLNNLQGIPFFHYFILSLSVWFCFRNVFYKMS